MTPETTEMKIDTHSFNKLFVIHVFHIPALSPLISSFFFHVTKTKQIDLYWFKLHVIFKEKILGWSILYNYFLHTLPLLLQLYIRNRDRCSWAVYRKNKKQTTFDLEELMFEMKKIIFSFIAQEKLDKI